MSNVKDLDSFVAENKTVKLGGKEYVLPGDLPFELYLRLNQAGELEDESEIKALEAMMDAVGDLFAMLYPDDRKMSVKGDVTSLLRSRGVGFNLTLVKAIYEDVDQANEGDDKPAEESPTQPEVGTPSTSS